jgi:hypothetical protein
MKIVKESLSPSEAVYGFASWLTVRDNPITLSAHHNASIVAELVDEFCKKQELEKPDDNWTDELVPMEESQHFERGLEPFDSMNIGQKSIIRKATNRIMNSVWILAYKELDPDTIEIVGYTRDDDEGYDRERELPKCRIIEDLDRKITNVLIKDKFVQWEPITDKTADHIYYVSNPKHVFDYGKGYLKQ